MKSPLSLPISVLLLSESFLSVNSLSSNFNNKAKQSDFEAARAEAVQTSDSALPLPASSAAPRSNGWSRTPNVIGPDQWLNSVSLSRSPNYFPQSWSGPTNGVIGSTSQHTANIGPYAQPPKTASHPLTSWGANGQRPVIDNQLPPTPSRDSMPSPSTWTNSASFNGAMQADVIKKVGLNEYQNSNMWRSANQAEAQAARMAEKARNAHLLAEENMRRLKAEAEAEVARLAEQRQKESEIAAAAEELRRVVAAEKEAQARELAKEKQQRRIADAKEETRTRQEVEAKEKQRIATAKEHVRAVKAAAEAEQEEKRRVAAAELEARARRVEEEKEKHRIASAEQEARDSKAVAEEEARARIAEQVEKQRLHAAVAAEKERQRIAAIVAEEETRARKAEQAEKQRIAAAAAEKEKRRIANAVAEEEKQRLAALAEEEGTRARKAEQAEKQRLAAAEKEVRARKAEQDEEARRRAEARKEEEKREIATAEEHRRVRLAAENNEARRLQVEAEAEAEVIRMAEKAKSARMLAEENVRRLKAKADAVRLSEQQQILAGKAAAEEKRRIAVAEEEMRYQTATEAQEKRRALDEEERQRKRLAVEEDEARFLQAQTEAEMIRMAEMARNARVLAEENVRRLRAEAESEAARLAIEHKKLVDIVASAEEKKNRRKSQQKENRPSAGRLDEKSRMAVESHEKHLTVTSDDGVRRNGFRMNTAAKGKSLTKNGFSVKNVSVDKLKDSRNERSSLRPRPKGFAPVSQKRTKKKRKTEQGTNATGPPLSSVVTDKVFKSELPFKSRSLNEIQKRVEVPQEEEVRVRTERTRAEEESRLAAIAEESSRRSLLQYRLSTEARMREKALEEEESSLAASSTESTIRGLLQYRLSDEAHQREIARKEESRLATITSRKQEESTRRGLLQYRLTDEALKRETAQQDEAMRVMAEKALAEEESRLAAISKHEEGTRRGLLQHRLLDEARRRKIAMQEEEARAKAEADNLREIVRLKAIAQFEEKRQLAEQARKEEEIRFLALARKQEAERSRQLALERELARLPLLARLERDKKAGQLPFDDPWPVRTDTGRGNGVNENNSNVNLTEPILPTGVVNVTDRVTLPVQKRSSSPLQEQSVRNNSTSKLFLKSISESIDRGYVTPKQDDSFSGVAPIQGKATEKRSEVTRQQIDRGFSEKNAKSKLAANLAASVNETKEGTKQHIETEWKSVAMAKRQEATRRVRVSDEARVGWSSSKGQESRMNAKYKEDRNTRFESELKAAMANQEEITRRGLLQYRLSHEVRLRQLLQIKQEIVAEAQAGTTNSTELATRPTRSGELESIAKRHEATRRGLLQYRLTNEAQLRRSIKNKQESTGTFPLVQTNSTALPDHTESTINESVVKNHEQRQRALLEYRLSNKSQSSSSTLGITTMIDIEKESKAKQAEAEAQAALALAESILASIDDETKVTRPKRKGASFVGSLLTNIERSKETGKLTIEVARGVFNIVSKFLKDVSRDQTPPAVHTGSDHEKILQEKEENARIAAEAARLAEEAARLEAARLKKIEEAIEARRKTATPLEHNTKTMGENKEEIEQRHTKRSVPFFASIRTPVEM